jgi:hypothetical protein
MTATAEKRFESLDNLQHSLGGGSGGDGGDGAGLGYQRVKLVEGSTYKDNSTVIIVPARNKMIHHRVVQAWQNLICPMNQARAFIFCIGDEVGHAYTSVIQNTILANPVLSKWKYVMTMETDNLPPPDAQIRLLESINMGFDAVSGIYFTKGDINQPMAYGDPAEYAQTGVLKFEPRDIRVALAQGRVMEVNGIAMGCSLYKMELFHQLPPPWFVTVNDVVEGKGIHCFTQDLFFCKRAREAGKRFAVDFRVRVGHLDLNTDVLY